VELKSSRERFIVYLKSHFVDERVLAAMTRVPREAFVPVQYYSSAYDDGPLPIGYGQTISQPLIVAMMSEALKLTGDELVLEVGTGSGYQTAILAHLARYVVSVERVPELVELAVSNLKKLNLNNLEIHLSQGELGWVEETPYDAILVAAAAPSIPQSLVGQLKLGGRLIIPVGTRWEQELVRLTHKQGENSIEYLGGCRFVPLIGREAWED
jgi:protein-L-isoaspartate(D-aspartate) O-methyltransferase